MFYFLNCMLKKLLNKLNTSGIYMYNLLFF